MQRQLLDITQDDIFSHTKCFTCEQHNYLLHEFLPDKTRHRFGDHLAATSKHFYHTIATVDIAEQFAGSFESFMPKDMQKLYWAYKTLLIMFVNVLHLDFKDPTDVAQIEIRRKHDDSLLTVISEIITSAADHFYDAQMLFKIVQRKGRVSDIHRSGGDYVPILQHIYADKMCDYSNSVETALASDGHTMRTWYLTCHCSLKRRIAAVTFVSH